jgi:hypothetical protein
MVNLRAARLRWNPLGTTDPIKIYLLQRCAEIGTDVEQLRPLPFTIEKRLTMAFGESVHRAFIV